MTHYQILLGWVAGLLLITGCDRLPAQFSESEAQSPEPVAVTPSPVPPVESTPAPTSPVRDPFADAVSLASSAFQLGQSARSQDDWSLVARRWQQAVDLLAAVPKSSANYATAQTKLSEYRRNLTYAQQQANKPIDQSSGVVVVRPGRPTSPTNTASSSSTRPPTQTRSAPTPVAKSESSVIVAPIVARAGGTPVINVRFNGTTVFPMIVDTGASGTLITAEMADVLNVQATGEAKVDTASQRNISLPLGLVQSIEVEGAIANDVLVAIAGPELDIGLLGHDFFGDYDVTVREDVVEFHHR